MNIRSWAGVLLVGQAVGYLPMHRLFDVTWLYWSLGLGVVGLVLILLNRRRTEFDLEEDDGLSPHRGTELTGSEILNLMDKLDS